MKYASFVAVALFLFSASDAEARSFRVSQVPNGSSFGCALCHNNGAGGGPRTGFGEQVFQSLSGTNTTTASVDWSAIYDLDGDSDGYSNGLELGDPDGTWTIGDPSPGSATDPSDRESNLCGDGILNGNEECDSDPMGATCDEMGLGPGGMVTCNDFCRLDFSTCEGFEPVNNNAGNNSTSNNSTGNNATGNSATGNNEMDEVIIDSGPVNDETADEDAACSTAGSTPGFLALLLGLFVIRRRPRRT